MTLLHKRLPMKKSNIQGNMLLSKGKKKNLPSKKLYTEERQNREHIVKLYRMVELKSIFIADVSHELRTSLTIMQCSMDIIAKDSDFKKEHIQLFKNISSEITRITSILTDLTLLTKTKNLKFKSHHKQFDIQQSTSSICKEVQVLADKKKIKIICTQRKNPIEILGSKDDIEKILLNLLKNAIAYNKIKGWIKVEIKKTKKGVYLFVKDNGVGISKKELPHIFERFYRIERSEIKKNKGSGLGLAICKHLVEQNNGKISVESTLHKGTVFTVFFPIYFR